MFDTWFWIVYLMSWLCIIWYRILNCSTERHRIIWHWTMDLNHRSMSYSKQDIESTIWNYTIRVFEPTSSYTIWFNIELYDMTLWSNIELYDMAHGTSYFCDFEAWRVVAFRKMIFVSIRKWILLTSYQQTVLEDTTKSQRRRVAKF